MTLGPVSVPIHNPVPCGPLPAILQGTYICSISWSCVARRTCTQQSRELVLLFCGMCVTRAGGEARGTSATRAKNSLTRAQQQQQEIFVCVCVCQTKQGGRWDFLHSSMCIGQAERRRSRWRALERSEEVYKEETRFDFSAKICRRCMCVSVWAQCESVCKIRLLDSVATILKGANGQMVGIN